LPFNSDTDWCEQKIENRKDAKVVVMPTLYLKELVVKIITIQKRYGGPAEKRNPALVAGCGVLDSSPGSCYSDAS
jgi:hypothetical protein